MKRIITAGLSTLVLTMIATPPVHAVAAPDSDNFVQQVLRNNEELDRAQAQETRVEPAMAITQPINQPQPKQPMNQAEKPASDETLGFEYFERQYRDRYGS